jgi:hypothetical protein
VADLSQVEAKKGALCIRNSGRAVGRRISVPIETCSSDNSVHQEVPSNFRLQERFGRAEIRLAEAEGQMRTRYVSRCPL